MLEAARQVLESDGALAVVALLAAEEPAAAYDVYAQLVLDAYWKQKDLSTVLVLASTGIQTALTGAGTAGEADQATKATRSAKALAYNLASFTWDGWDEPGIAIGATERRIGLDAARLNLQLGLKVAGPKLPLRRDYWMMGAHELSAGRYVEGAGHFAESAKLALQDEAMAEALLAVGFGVLAKVLTEPENQAFRAEMAKVFEELEKVEHGADFVGQIETAGRVFGSLD